MLFVCVVLFSFFRRRFLKGAKTTGELTKNQKSRTLLLGKCEEEEGNNPKMKVSALRFQRDKSLRVGDVLTDLPEQRQDGNNHAAGAALQYKLF